MLRRSVCSLSFAIILFTSSAFAFSSDATSAKVNVNLPEKPAIVKDEATGKWNATLSGNGFNIR